MKTNKLNFIMSLIPILSLIILTLYLVAINKYPLFLTLTIACIIAALIARFYFKVTIEQINKEISRSIKNIAPALLILLAIGLLSSSFMYSGIVPSLMYYSFKFISPSIYLPAIIVVIAVVSVAIGSSFTSSATVGVALFTTGVTMGFDAGLLVGAIVSGAMFGDKLSPLSDTTNISALKSGTDLFTHIKTMLSDTLIAFLLTLIIFTVINSTVGASNFEVDTASFETALKSTFVISPLLAVLPILLILFTYLKIPVIPSILLMSFIAFIVSFTIQDFSAGEVINSMFSSTSIVDPQTSEYASLFNRGGVSTMQGTISIILLASVFGGILNASKMISTILSSIDKFLQSPKTIIVSTMFTAILVAFASGAQFLAILLPIDTFKDKFDEHKIRKEQLSRAVESGGTVVIALVPWGAFCVFFASTFGVAEFDFIPYIFFAILTPIITIIKVLLTKNDKLVLEEK